MSTTTLPPSRLRAAAGPIADWRSPVSAGLAAVRRREILVAFSRARLLHFLVLGGLIFWFAPPVDPRREIPFESATFSALEAAQAQRQGTPKLGQREAAQVRARAIEDEVLYREGLRLGFDRVDNVVRQRLIQKVLFLAEDLAGATRPPSEEELRAFFAETRAQWTRPAEVEFLQVYATTDHVAGLAELRSQVIAAEAVVPGRAPALGDPLGLPREATLGAHALAARYGDGFAREVWALPLDTWSEPIRSKLGWHLVKVRARREAGQAEFDEVRGRLPLAHMVARKQRAAREYVREAAARYRITVDGAPIAGLSGTEREVADRVEARD